MTIFFPVSPRDCQTIWICSLSFFVFIIVGIGPSTDSYSPNFPLDANAQSDATYLFSIDINTANSAELQVLPGIGEKLGDAILLYRNVNGPFLSPQSIRSVKGIGEKRLEGIMPFLRNTPPQLPNQQN
ncbi:MAG: ComEA family DNA-binding protein [Thermoguttaceae bacterium]